MKKLLALLLAIVMILSLAACSSEAESKEEEEKPAASENKDENKDEGKEEDPTEAAIEDEEEPSEAEEEEPSEIEEEEEEPSEAKSDYEIMWDLIDEYNELVDDTIALMEAEGVDAVSDEITARTVAWQEKYEALNADNDLTADQLLEFSEEISASLDRLYAAMDELQGSEGGESSEIITNKSDYELMWELIDEYNEIVDDTIAMLENGDMTASEEISERTQAWQEKCEVLYTSTELTEEDLLEFSNEITASVERLYAAMEELGAV